MLLDVKNLRVAFRRDGREIVPVRDVSFTVPEHGRVALVGESGCGKSLTALSLMRLSPTDRATVTGSVKVPPRIAYVFQNPTDSLNPVMRICDQIREALPREMDRTAQDARIVQLLARTGLPNPQRAAHAYPCELSGGQQQRCMIAMALAAAPDLLVADEPTTALDVTTQKQVLELIDSLAAETGMAVLLITHNLGLVAGRMDFVNVMYAGQIVEAGPVTEVLAAPCHPYTKGLLAAVPALDAPRDAPLADIPGTVPPPDRWPPGCAFAPRCAQATDACTQGEPPVAANGDRRWRCFLKET
ncbi:MAG: ABC transporter ATP-binding protein [Kiritimatiellae bacterium]|nr:ABC transporter ATP-binding protein [Kiritimatiellia bacterium]